MDVALIGLGEVGQVLAQDLPRSPQMGRITFWDIAFDDASSSAARYVRQVRPTLASDARTAVRDADLVISAVTAANTLLAARSVSAGLRSDSWYLDLNSASPDQKRAAAAAVEAAGGRYVEAAVMSPIQPRRLAAPLLLGGPHAAEFASLATELGFSALTVYSADVGRAAATKLCRSVVVKGLEALVTESMLAARAYGVEADVLGSLGNVIPVDDWPAYAAYLMSRTTEHGLRRAEEMDEAAETLAHVGVEPLMARATARRQESSGRQHVDAEGLSAAALADRLRSPGQEVS